MFVLSVALQSSGGKAMSTPTNPASSQTTHYRPLQKAFNQDFWQPPPGCYGKRLAAELRKAGKVRRWLSLFTDTIEKGSNSMKSIYKHLEWSYFFSPLFTQNWNRVIFLIACGRQFVFRSSSLNWAHRVIIYFKQLKQLGRGMLDEEKEDQKKVGIFFLDFGDYLSWKHCIFLPDLEEAEED